MLPPHFNKQRHKELLRMALWEGQMSRRRVIQALGATAIRASQRIRELRDELPHWFSWDSKTRSYLTTAIAYQEAEKDLSARTRICSCRRILPNPISTQTSQPKPARCRLPHGASLK